MSSIQAMFVDNIRGLELVAQIGVENLLNRSPDSVMTPRIVFGGEIGKPLQVEHAVHASAFFQNRGSDRRMYTHRDAGGRKLEHIS